MCDLGGTDWTAELVLGELTPGMRMKTLFDTAKAASGIAQDELERLFGQPSYEARMAAFCILDFQARSRLGDLGLRAVAEVLHADPDPLVHKPVGIYLAYAGERLPDRLDAFLETYGTTMPRPGYRLVVRKRA